MKAKKIIAIGLVAAMTLGMSTSVFASANPYATVDPKDAPQFSGWDNDYLPTDNVFHAKGQGWLESGVGINETVTNVIVPTMPNLTLKYGDPGLYDFGFDPQRLVDRTGAKKYENKMNFTPQAKESGVYFLNGPRTSTETGWNPALNTFDNKSIKLVGTNIGTEPVAFTVTARTKEGKNFTYLEADPSPVVAKTADQVYKGLYNDPDSKIGETWATYVRTHGWDDEERKIVEVSDTEYSFHSNPTMFDLAKDLVDLDCHYDLDNVPFNDDQKIFIDNALGSLFAKGSDAPIALKVVITNVAPGASNLDALMDGMKEYVEVGVAPEPSDDPTPVDPSAVGMYLGLNTALGTQQSLDENYEAASHATAILPANVEKENEGKFDAEATATERVEGTPENYDWDYTSAGEYGKFIIDNPKPFQTVAFWFDGVATKNNEVVMYDEATHPEGVKIPKFEFTWTFSKDKDKFPPEPEAVVVDPTLVSYGVDAEHLNPIPLGFNNTFFADDYKETGLVLKFDLGSYNKISNIKYSRPEAPESWDSYLSPDIMYTINNDELTITTNVFGVVATNQEERYWKVIFVDDQNKETSIVLTFKPGSGNN